MKIGSLSESEINETSLLINMQPQNPSTTLIRLIFYREILYHLSWQLRLVTFLLKCMDLLSNIRYKHHGITMLRQKNTYQTSKNNRHLAT